MTLKPPSSKRAVGSKDPYRRPIEDELPELADTVDRLARENGNAVAASDLRVFTQSLFSDAPPELLKEGDAETLARAALSLWHFSQQRQPGVPRIRVFDADTNEHGFGSNRTIVEIVNDDMPFLVDSTTHALTRLGAEIVVLLHPIVGAARDDDGRLIRLQTATPGQPAESPQGEVIRESWMQIHLRRQAIGRHDGIRRTILDVLDDVRLAVDDWPSMREACQQRIRELESNPPPLDPSEIGEAIDFLRWLDDDHFTYLGAREYRFEGEGESAIGRIAPDSNFGILRDDSVSVFDGLRHLGKLPGEIQQFIHEPTLVRVNKANRVSTVHRAANLDAISIKAFDDNGQVIGEHLLVGLFTSTAYSASMLDVPLIRRKAEQVIESCGFVPGTHNGRALLHVLESHPRDEMFQLDSAELCKTARRILEIKGSLQIALITRIDPFERFVSCLVYVPRERFETDLRKRFQRILEHAFHGHTTTYYTLLTDEPLARLHVILKTTPGHIPRVDQDQLELALRQSGESWPMLLERELIDTHGEEEGLDKSRRWGHIFDAGYREYYGPSDAVSDIDAIEELFAVSSDNASGAVLRLARGRNGESDSLQLKFYTLQSMAPLWLVLQRLARLGLQVMIESHFDLPLDEGETLWIREIDARVQGRLDIDLDRVRDDFLEALHQIWAGNVENDSFNRLVLAAGLSAREVWVIRAYARYLNQLQAPFGSTYLRDLLARRGDITRMLLDLFLARFDPTREDERARSVADLSRRIEDELDRVESLDEDRVFRLFLNLIDSTVRTNYFQTDTRGGHKPYLAFKIDSQRLLEIPEPRPWREIWVHGPEVEGVHLRGGPVARGGLRWSDRLEDFRTEVLGLMKAQMVKNAVIVPEGSKGGFVVRRPADEREQLKEQVASAYRTFICGLLDLTDNLSGGEIVPPIDTVRWDTDDPYLVVAADKGTATFSDLANSISGEYGYWLDDAFASGGSAGYDHKKMGITARGAWESVKRHFREMGRDIDSGHFTVVGVGDMSGDVFGNGMLMSSNIRLIAAFNHKEVFIDPEPDALRSFDERRRLYELPGSAWSDYRSDCLSTGGGVFSRSAKSISLSPEIQSWLGVDDESMPPNELIRTILRADVDLLWFGGIGTYIKASVESHVTVGDRVNDPLRIDASEVRAEVIAEGANLGLTQRARVECALRGVHLNTDFIDNSGGVDCSDREVNLKILLGAAETAGKIDRPTRNELLRDMTDEVARLVIRDNYLQTQSMTVTSMFGDRLLGRLARTIRTLEREGHLDRRLEFMPSDDDLDERRKKGQALTRPELAILLCYAKNDLFRSLVGSDSIHDPALHSDLKRYFPTTVRSRFSEEIQSHRLAPQIIATALANEVVNRAGITFVYEVARRSGHSRGEVILAFAAAREILEVRSLWRSIEELDGQASAETQAHLLADCGRLLERGCLALLRRSHGHLEVQRLIVLYSEGFARLRSQVKTTLSPEQTEAYRGEIARLLGLGLPSTLAERIEASKRLVSAFDVIDIARDHERALDWVARVYFETGDRFSFDWLRAAARAVDVGGAWERMALGSIIDELFHLQASLTGKVVGAPERDDLQPTKQLERWLDERAAAVRDVDQLLAEMRRQHVDIALLTVATQTLKGLLSVG